MKLLVGPSSGRDVPESNWLPAPPGRPFMLTLRAYVPSEIMKQGGWFPPAPQLQRAP